MSPEEKIAKVLQQLKNDAAINPEPNLVKFELNHFIVGAGILSDDEERRILFKLRKEGVIKLRLSEHEDDTPREVTVISSIDGERFATSQYYWVELLDGFEEKYKSYISYLKPKESNVTRLAKKTLERHLVVSGDYVAGDKVGRDKKVADARTSPQKIWWKKPEIMIPIAIAIISIPWWPGWGHWIKQESVGISTATSSSVETIATSTLNIATILDKNFTFSTEAEKRDFREKYLNEEVYGVGKFVNRDKVENYRQYLYLAVGRYPVVCVLENPSEELVKKLTLLTSDSKFVFTGFFTGSGMAFAAVEGSWVINNCTLYFQ